MLADLEGTTPTTLLTPIGVKWVRLETNGCAGLRVDYEKGAR